MDYQAPYTNIVHFTVDIIDFACADHLDNCLGNDFLVVNWVKVDFLPFCSNHSLFLFMEFL